ncbi:MAG: Gfo/Idh/MocA family oxidoreductase [Planctomycetes bacterium]|nr:Gfo/Idh/MocA family oxidoreductase [Planctomycetota bacterium]
MMNRRRFLQWSTAVTLPTIVPSSALGHSSSVAPSDRIAMGFIGLGTQGTSLMRAFLGHKDVQVVAVCDVLESQRQEAKDLVDQRYGNADCLTYNDFRAVCGRKDIDAVCIATPDHWHVLVSLEAARNGKDMYTEKALGLAVAWDKALQVACRRYGTVFQWGTQQRSDRNFRFACELVRNGRIGKLQTILVGVPHDFPVPNQPTQPVPPGLDYDLWLGPAPWAPYTYQRCRPWTKEESYSNWYHISDYCLGGIGGYWGVHHVDIAQWGHGTDDSGPVEIEGTAVFPKDGLADCAISWKVTHKYADGVTMVYMDNKQHKQGVTFQGSEGWVHVSRQGIWAEPESLLKAVIGPDEVHLIESTGHQRNFLDAVKTRGPTICPIDVAVRTDTICHLTDICTRLGRKLHWDPQKEDFVNDPEAGRMLSRSMRSPWQT